MSPKEKKTGILSVVQTSPVIGDVDNNLAHIEQVLASLPQVPHRLVVFPELATTGYFFEDRNHLNQYAEKVPRGSTTQHLISLAQKHNAYIVSGLPEKEGDSIYNSAVLVGPKGFIKKYRKLHLWSEEKLFFDPGDLGLVVAKLPFANIGMMICYDMWFPEQARVLGLMGADILAVPSALVWNDTPAHKKHGYYMADYVGMTTAHLNQVYLALASQVGHYDGKWLFGSSLLASPFGWPLTEPANDQEPEVLQTEVDYRRGREVQSWGSMDDFDQDRRTDVYGNLLGYSPK